MDLFKSVLELIVSGIKRVDVDIVYALLLFYLVMAALLLFVRFVREVRQ